MRTTNMLAYVGVIIASSGFAFWAGCGSDEATTPSDGDGGTSSSGGSSSGATSSSGAASSSGGSSSGGTNDAGDGGSSSGGNPDGGIDPPDAGPGGSTTSLTCGSTTCALPAQQCCVVDLPGPGNRSYGCAAAGDAGCPAPDAGNGGDINVTALKCSGAANCPASTKCCVRETPSGAASQCKADCAGNEAQLCDPNAGATDGCPQQDPCSNDNINDWGLPNTYATCGGQGN